jgi:hypothetical protein
MDEVLVLLVLLVVVLFGVGALPVAAAGSEGLGCASFPSGLGMGWGDVAPASLLSCWGCVVLNNRTLSAESKHASLPSAIEELLTKSKAERCTIMICAP